MSKDIVQVGPLFRGEDHKVKVTVLSEQGKEAVVAVMGPDEFCGEGCLTGQPRRMATAKAMTECEIMRLEKKAIMSGRQRAGFMWLPSSICSRGVSSVGR
jgi:hypothetical protein